MSYGLIATLIVLAIVIGAITTKKCEAFLIAGSMIGAVVLWKWEFLSKWVSTLEEVVSDEAYVILICGLFGSLVALLTESKGSLGFTKIVTKICNTERKTLFTTFILGILIFVDDYLNVLSIGTAMKGSYDKKKIPRESLAYLLDSTGAPVCVLMPFSSWAAYFGAIFLQQECIKQLAGGNLMKTYMLAVPYCIYPIAALIIVFLFCMGWMPKLGGMKKAYKRVAETGKTYSDASRKYNVASQYENEEGRSVWFFIIPLAILVGIAVATGNLVIAAIISIIVCMVLYMAGGIMDFSKFWDTFVKGFSDMLPIIILLISALTFQKIASEMKMTEFFVTICKPFMSGSVFPVITFIIVGLLAFMIANAWGVCTLVAPVLIPLGASVGANLVLVMAAILSGCAFGNHACFYCDTTVLASHGAGLDNLEHAESQLPYVLLGAIISIVGFLVLGFIK